METKAQNNNHSRPVYIGTPTYWHLYFLQKGYTFLTEWLHLFNPSPTKTSEQVTNYINAMQR